MPCSQERSLAQSLIAGEIFCAVWWEAAGRGFTAWSYKVTREDKARQTDKLPNMSPYHKMYRSASLYYMQSKSELMSTCTIIMWKTYHTLPCHKALSHMYRSSSLCLIHSPWQQPALWAGSYISIWHWTFGRDHYQDPESRPLARFPFELNMGRLRRAVMWKMNRSLHCPMSRPGSCQWQTARDTPFISENTPLCVCVCVCVN